MQGHLIGSRRKSDAAWRMRQRITSSRTEEGNMTGWRPKIDDAKVEFREAVINKQNEEQEEKLETIQKKALKKLRER